MKTEYNEILIDLKAAISLERVESISAVIERLYLLPEITSNQIFDDSLIDHLIIPFGISLAESGTEISWFENLIKDDLATLRAIGAVGIYSRFLKDFDVPVTQLNRAAMDPRSDVRKVIGRMIGNYRYRNNNAIIGLANDWTHSVSPRLRQTALRITPALLSNDPKYLLTLLDTFALETDLRVIAELVKTLKAVALDVDVQIIFQLFAKWIDLPSPNLWVISRVLDSSWALNQINIGRTLELLKELKSREELSKQLVEIDKLIKKHNLEIPE